MEINEILPLDDLRSRFETPVNCVQWGLPDYKTLFMKNKADVTNVAFNGWYFVLTSGKFGFHPHTLKQHILAKSIEVVEIKKTFVPAMEKLIGEKLYLDLSCSECTLEDNTLKEKVCCRLFLAHTYPNILHLANVKFQNPYRPITDPRRKYFSKDYEGLHLFPTLLARMEQFAREKGIGLLSLTAAAPDMIPFFKKFGFDYGKNSMAQFSRAMEKRVSSQ